MAPTNLTLLMQLLAVQKSQLKMPLPDYPGGCSRNVYEKDHCAPFGMEYKDFGLKPGFVAAAGARVKRNALRCPRWIWPEAEIPYTLDVEDPLILQRFHSAIAEIHGISCVRFVPRSLEDVVWLRVSEAAAPRCRATVGLTRPQPYVHLSSSCSRGQVLHELLHVMGFSHEHMRPDRGDYVRVLCENVNPNMTTDFRQLRPGVVDDFGEPYDFYSIMHYRLDHFSRNGLDTLEPLQEVDRRRVGLMEELSAADIRKINRLYPCE